MWYGGLRGGICFILALRLELDQNYRKEFRSLVLGATVVMVFISVLVLGTGCRFMVKFLRLETGHNSEEDMTQVAVPTPQQEEVEETVYPLQRTSTFNRVFSKYVECSMLTEY
jgi:NhaP-type Na+/H+ or K+/H+ antiporter